MSVSLPTTDVTLINLVMTGADGVGGAWQDPVQLVPLGMNNDPADFVARIREGLPLVNNLRILFNEHSFNPDGSMHPQMEVFLAEAVAQGFDLTICYGEGDAQNIGRGYDRWPRLTNAEGYAALEENFGDISGAWQSMMDWMAAHRDVAAGVYGYELINESASYRETIRYNGAGEGYSMADFVGLFTDHAVALAQMINAQAEGRILVGGWGFNGDFTTLANTMIDGQSALDILRAGVGADLVWSSHFYPGWLGTGSALSPADLAAQLAAVYAPLGGDAVLVTEINADGQVNNPLQAADFADFFTASYEWFADNGIGLGWYPGVQTGASHLLTLETNGGLTYRHQHSLAHAMNAFSLAREAHEPSTSQSITASLTTVRLRNETYEITAGEALFDPVTLAGFAFGYGGNDTVRGTNSSTDFLYGGTGNDALLGYDAEDFLYGQDGSDRLYGGGHNDLLFGGRGDDQLDGGAGADQMLGGQGNDVYIVDASTDVLIEYAGEGTDRVSTKLDAYTLGTNIENLTYTGTGNFTGAGNDLRNLLTGGAGADILSGMDGVDTLRGGAGQDQLKGGRGGDLLDGGEGTDTASYIDATSGVWADLARTILSTSAGEAAGDRFVSVERLRGSNHVDQLWGDAAANALWGMSGNDTIAGRGGNDTLYGGLGDDRFIFALGDAADRVSDFQDNRDTLAFQGFAGVSTVQDALARAVQSGANVVFTFGNGDALTVLNTTLAALTDDILIL